MIEKFLAGFILFILKFSLVSATGILKKYHAWNLILHQNNSIHKKSKKFKSRSFLLQTTEKFNIHERMNWEYCKPIFSFPGDELKFCEVQNKLQFSLQVKRGHPSTATPAAVGQWASGQLSRSFPHQLRVTSCNPNEKYSSTPMKARPASNAPERT